MAAVVDGKNQKRFETADDQIAQALQSCALFEGMGPEAMNTLVRGASLRDVPKGGILFLQDDESYEVYVVVSGRIRLYRMSPDGAEKTLAVHGDYEVFGDLAAIDGLARSAVAESMTDSAVVEIQRDAFITCLQGSWDLSERFMKKLARMLRETDESLDLLAFASAKARVSSTLARNSDQCGRVMGLTHRDIAAMASTSRETVSRVIGDLVDSGLVAVDDEGYSIIDMEGLMELSSL
ncbi:MAG: Crp/Fnr family transcriptional regulator [Firmicutes bacterium]|nr:Crp/Fnr family transcriptional regulator [Bacillota bacterium]MDD4336157.1 Crp/Fnr family transcriptional regulator [Bacillota bacterium]MDD4791998.1 Crp/Fnr family transcriptional regulator [Bacillota bacterium]